MMLVKRTAGKVNFIDANDAFVGFDFYANCCEDFGYYMAPSVVPIGDVSVVVDDAILDGFVFDTTCEPVLEEYGSYDCGECVAFRLVHKTSGAVMYLHLYNSHNGYYGHGWSSSWGCEGYL